MKLKHISAIICLFIIASACNKSTEEGNVASWQQVANGVWKQTVGNKDAVTLLDAAGAIPDLERLNQFEEADFPLDREQIHIEHQNNKLYLRFPLDEDEDIYGLGLHFKSVNRRGKLYHLQVDHYDGKDNGRTHAPVPFYVSSKGYGVLINTARYLDVYVGTGVRVDSPNKPVVYDRNTDPDWDPQPKSDIVEILIPDDKAEIIIFRGDTLLDVVRKYNLYSGGGCLPPKWGLGFTYRTHTLFSAEDVINEVNEFERQGFPLDFIGLEPGWMNRSYPCSYEWDEGRFPEPGKFVKTLLDKRVRTNLWINPYIAPKATLYEPMLPLSGSHTVWNGIVPDYSMEETRKVFTDFYTKHQLDIGVSGLKIDEVDGYDNWLWPNVASFPSGIDAEQMRQTYGLLLQDMITDLYHQKNVRTYGLVRASNAGASRFPFVIYNDYYKHEDFITALVNSGFSGLLWTPEVRSSPTGEEWLRRMQAVCFSPMAMINAWYSGTKPWSYPEVYEDVKNVALLRMQLLPYIYSTFADYHFNGTPPVRPMQLLDNFVQKDITVQGVLDDTKNPYKMATQEDIKDQYMFGDNILVAPIFAGQKSRKVILPAGKWYDFYTGDYVGENKIIHVDSKLEEIPLYVKDGGIIPMIQPRLHAPERDELQELEVRHYGEADGEFLLYDDDGETFDYEQGAFSWTRLKTKRDANGRLMGNEQRISGDLFNYKTVRWTFMGP
ncbi:TIM-barrel domain-containing protein [Seonamhaeicola sp.]|uniref:TIM-barrel domain-containing protein n=1 Tax=Seonamhaeicola sp. TaxID=1912245 RepID=UPI00261B425E|nr:TIM-barrel domain-containing protein [Seonamhaeicola sp.]